MPLYLRLTLGNVSDNAQAQILETLRPLYRSDDIGWYVIEESAGDQRTHPRSPSHRWTETESDE